jgi:hypothetical protein
LAAEVLAAQALEVTPHAARRPHWVREPGDVERLGVHQDRPTALGPTRRPVHATPNRGTDRRLLGSTQVAAMLDVNRQTLNR